MKGLRASALAAVMLLLLVTAGACRTTGTSVPWGGDSAPAYGPSSRSVYRLPSQPFPYPRLYGSPRGTRYPGDNERCSDRRQACEKWSSKRGRYIPDYGETRRQYGCDAEEEQRQRQRS